MKPRRFDWDVIIIGGGPSGLSAALVLGRCCRQVLLCDAGKPRNWATKKMHGFLSRDGICPTDFASTIKQDLARYENVRLMDAEIVEIEKIESGFQVRLPDGTAISCRKLLLATGVMDELPEIEGILDFFGKSVFQCPYCDGWELRGTPIAVYGKGQRGLEMARAMTAWTHDIVLCTDGTCRLKADDMAALARNGIRVTDKRIARLDGADGQLEMLVFRDGERLARRALFFDTKCHAQSPLAEALGCAFTKQGGVECGRYQATSVAGLYVAGNIIKDVQMAVVAAAEGAKAAFGINKALTREDFDRPRET